MTLRQDDKHLHSFHIGVSPGSHQRTQTAMFCAAAMLSYPQVFDAKDSGKWVIQHTCTFEALPEVESLL